MDPLSARIFARALQKSSAVVFVGHTQKGGIAGKAFCAVPVSQQRPPDDKGSPESLSRKTPRLSPW